MLNRFLTSVLNFVGRLAYRGYMLLGGLLVTVIVLFTLFPQLSTGFHTALFVTQVLNVPVKPQAWFTATPVREEITYPRPDELGQADVYYVPDGKRRAGLLVFLGANAAGTGRPGRGELWQRFGPGRLRADVQLVADHGLAEQR